MKVFIAIVTVFVLILNTMPAYAECSDAFTWLKTFPDSWALKSEYKVGELTVRIYRSPDNWLGIFYRTDYPSIIEEALITVAPSEVSFSSGMRHITSGERHYLVRLVRPASDFYECWREVQSFVVEVEAKTNKPGVRFTIVEVEKEKGQ